MAGCGGAVEGRGNAVEGKGVRKRRGGYLSTVS